MLKGSAPLGGFPFAPVMGVAPLPSAHEVARRLADAAARVELLIGFTRHDAAPFVAMDRRIQRLRRPGNVVTPPISWPLTRRILGRPALDLAKLWTANGGRAATFRVDWSPPGAPLGACHCIELPLLLGSPDSWSDAPMLGAEPDPIDKELARKTRGYWAAFAHNGIDALDGSSLRI